MTRTDRKLLAEQTLRIIRQGGYEADNGRRVAIGEAVARSVAGTALIRPAEWPAILRRAAEQSAAEHGVAGPRVEVTGETTLAAARRLVAAHGNVLALNFASAKNPGGGFLGGSQAQEESLARSSALYETLLIAPGYYAANRHERSAYYTDHMIYSPAVPVFRDDEGTLLDEPYEVTFLTAPAVNCSALRQHHQYDAGRVERTMGGRVNKVLALAATKGHDTLVLGAWGCGAFGNDPAMIAGLFSDALATDVGRCFAQVTFAVFEPAPGQPVFAAFQRLLA
jgi:uncharacterized protein (TIGR02452 family)